MEETAVFELLEKCKEYEKISTCNKKHVGAAVSTNDYTYLGSNGSKTNPCTKKGLDYCQRDYVTGEYLSCPSPCAEGEAILAALDDKKKIEGSVIVTTSFPCNRCKDIIIDLGVKELYFLFKPSEIDFKDLFYIAQMTINGVYVNRIYKPRGEKELEIENMRMPLDLERFAASALRNNGHFYIRLMRDENLRKQTTKISRHTKRSLLYEDDDSKGVIIKPVL